MTTLPLRENHLFVKCTRGGARSAHGCLVVSRLADKKANLLRRQNPQKEKVNRVGITATKKVGGAVERNRARRLIREAFRLTERETLLRRGQLLVIAARPTIVGKKMGEVKRDLRRCLLDLGMFAAPASGASGAPVPPRPTNH